MCTIIAKKFPNIGWVALFWYSGDMGQTGQTLFDDEEYYPFQEYYTVDIDASDDSKVSFDGASWLIEQK